MNDFSSFLKIKCHIPEKKIRLYLFGSAQPVSPNTMSSRVTANRRIPQGYVFSSKSSPASEKTGRYCRPKMQSHFMSTT